MNSQEPVEITSVSGIGLQKNKLMFVYPGRSRSKKHGTAKQYGIGLLGVTRLDWVAIHILMAIVMHQFRVIINLLPSDIFSPRGEN